MFMLFNFEHVSFIILHHVISRNFMLKTTSGVVWILIHKMFRSDEITTAIITFLASTLIDMIVHVLLPWSIVSNFFD